LLHRFRTSTKEKKKKKAAKSVEKNKFAHHTREGKNVYAINARLNGNRGHAEGKRKAPNPVPSEKNEGAKGA